MALVEQGVAPSTVEDVDFSGVTRVRDEVGPDDGPGVDARRDEVLGVLDGLR